MNPVKMLTVLVAVASLHIPVLSQAGTTDFEDFSQIDLEDLLAQVVVTASRYEQKISESPVATTVITAEDIRASGAMNIPDVLRMVPGLEVMAATASDFNVGARGFNTLSSNKMLVLVDGRSVYMDFYGLIMWEALPVGLDEIRRIEVIKGPGSALYGANAFSGVINILTKSPEESRGTQLSATTGEYGTHAGSLLHGGARGRIGYRVSAGWKETRTWEDTDLTSAAVARFNGHLGYAVGDATRLSLAGGLSNGTIALQNPAKERGTHDYDGPVGYLQADYQWHDLSVRMFWNAIRLATTPNYVSTVASGSELNLDTFDAELQHSLALNTRNLLVWGGSYRTNAISWDCLDTDHRQDLYATFLCGESRLSDALIISAGGRYDHHPLAKGHFSPRGSVVYSPAQDHALRASYGTAFRSPTLLESYWHLEIPYGPEMTGVMEGNPGLEAERVTSTEVGYQALLSRKVMVQLSLFHNRLDNFISAVSAEYFASPPAPYPGIPSKITFVNGGEAVARGGEMGCNLWLSDRVRGSFNYAYQQIEDQETGVAIKSSPEHKLNGEVRLAVSNRLAASLQAHWVSETEWPPETWTGAEATETVEAFTLLNGRIGYTFPSNHYELSLACFNLLGKRHREHPLAEQLDRRMTVSLRMAL